MKPKRYSVSVTAPDLTRAHFAGTWEEVVQYLTGLRPDQVAFVSISAILAEMTV